MNRYGVNRSPSLGVYSSTLGDELTVDAILDGQRMEMKHAGENRLHLLRRRVFKVHPEKQVRVRQQRRHEEQINVPRVQASLRGEGK